MNYYPVRIRRYDLMEHIEAAKNHYADDAKDWRPAKKKHLVKSLLFFDIYYRWCAGEHPVELAKELDMDPGTVYDYLKRTELRIDLYLKLKDV